MAGAVGLPEGGGGLDEDVRLIEAVVLQASRLQRRMAGAVGLPEGGGGLDEDVRLMLGMYRKAALGVGV